MIVTDSSAKLIRSAPMEHYNGCQVGRGQPGSNTRPATYLYYAWLRPVTNSLDRLACPLNLNPPCYFWLTYGLPVLLALILHTTAAESY